MLYQIQYNDSPAKIARKFGLSMQALISANPQKPTTIVAGTPTWSVIRVGETVNVPLGGIVGQAVPAESKKAAIESLMFIGGPCIEANVAVVCGVQAILGVSSDGKWGSGTSAEARKYVPNAPAGCSPRPAWWAPVGKSNCTGEMPIWTAPPLEPVAPPPAFPADAVSSLVGINPCLESNAGIVCAAQELLGVTVDGKYGNDTASAARARVPSAPPACSPRPEWWAPPGQSHCAPPPAPPAPPPPPPPPVLPPPVSVTVPPAVQALLTFNPCLEANALAVCAAQKALGVTVDGKYGSGTATAARSLLPNAPVGCSPRPAWWAPPGQSNCVPRPPPPPPPVIPPPVEPPPVEPPPVEPPPPDKIEITPPEKKGISTGAVIAGGLGAAALVGIVAVAATRKQVPTKKRRKPTKRKKTTKRRKTRKKKRK